MPRESALAKLKNFCFAAKYICWISDSLQNWGRFSTLWNGAVVSTSFTNQMFRFHAGVFPIDAFFTNSVIIKIYLTIWNICKYDYVYCQNIVFTLLFVRVYQHFSYHCIFCMYVKRVTFFCWFQTFEIRSL